jgi:tetratricopeptide (TPR) repeat protein
MGKQARKRIVNHQQHTPLPREREPQHLQLLKQAVAFHTAGDLGKALAFYDQAIDIDLNYATAHFNKGIALRQLGRYDEELTAFDQALAINPAYAEAHFNRGFALQELGRYNEALAAWDQALAINTAYTAARFNKGIALQKLGRSNEALTAFDQTLAINPAYAEAHFNRGFALQELRRYEEALTAFDQALAINPAYAEAHYNRGVILQELRIYEEALSSYNHAIAINPNFALSQWNKSLLLLLRGDYEEGWRLYEWRHEVIKPLVHRFAKPLWLGDAEVMGKTILLYQEQGYGDTIQMLRYIPLLAECDARVIISAPGPLVHLASTLPGVAGILGKGEPLPEFDLHCPFMSLPLAFKTTLETIPVAVPYLKTPENKVAWWQSRLGEKTCSRIGLVWSGVSGYGNDHRRSIALETLLPLLDRNAEFHSLQIEYRDADRKLLEILKDRLRDHSKEIVDFGDTAALIEEMDLVISVDTSVAHLAGALGKPVWILLPYAPDFRWLIDRDDSPWYPTARIFRQPVFDAWGRVVEKVMAVLSHSLSLD